MSITGVGKKVSYRQYIINEINQYNPENSFVEFEKKLHDDLNFEIVIANSTDKPDIIKELIKAAGKRISFLIEDDDKILELYKENKELLDKQMSPKMYEAILQMRFLVSNAKSKSSSVETICQDFANDGSSIFASQKVLKYLQCDENLVNWIYAEHEKDASIKYINKLCALMIVEHIHGDTDELKEIATKFPRSIYLALADKLRNAEKEKDSNSETIR